MAQVRWPSLEPCVKVPVLVEKSLRHCRQRNGWGWMLAEMHRQLSRRKSLTLQQLWRAGSRPWRNRGRPRRKSLTLQQLWREYREAHPDGCGYSQYCGLYREWKVRRSPVMLQENKAGEKLFVDCAGQTVTVCNSESGVVFRLDRLNLSHSPLRARSALPAASDAYLSRRCGRLSGLPRCLKHKLVGRSLGSHSFLQW